LLLFATYPGLLDLCFTDSLCCDHTMVKVADNLCNP